MDLTVSELLDLINGTHRRALTNLKTLEEYIAQTQNVTLIAHNDKGHYSNCKYVLDELSKCTNKITEFNESIIRLTELTTQLQKTS